MGAHHTLTQVYIVIAVAEVLGSISAGRAADALGSDIVLLVALIVEILAVAVVCGVALGWFLAGNTGWYVAGALLGLADSGFQVRLEPTTTQPASGDEEPTTTSQPAMTCARASERASG
jgi:MFS family permease